VQGDTYQAVWGRVFAAAYDTAFALAEKRGLETTRKEVVGQARGRVLELGAGTGLNVNHYPDKGITELMLAEPNPHMVTRLRKRVEHLSSRIVVLEATAEDLPVGDSSVDSVVSTLVLCTVVDPRRTLEEITRVLRPGGQFLFAEHVRSELSVAARWQDRLDGAWGWYACGCHCNRDTVSMINDTSLTMDSLRKERLRWISPLVRPLAVGLASKRS
jgi:ubiquinone/menaquinone biosynthesis C-methylase UbiE